MGERTTIALPFAEGLAQQEAIEWQDSGASASGLTNGNFTKQGAVDKRLGMARLGFAAIGGGRLTSWSRAGLSLVTSSTTSAYLYDYSQADGEANAVTAVGPVSNVAVSRTPLPSNPTPLTPVSALVPWNSATLRVTAYVNTAASGVQSVLMVAEDANTGSSTMAPVTVYTGADNTHQLLVVQVLYVPLATSSQAVSFCIYDTSAGGNIALIGTFNLATSSATVSLSQTNLTDTPELALFDGYAGGAVLFAANLSGTLLYRVFSSSSSTLGSGTLATGVTGTGKVSAYGNTLDTVAVFVFGNGNSVQAQNVSTTTLNVSGGNYTLATLPYLANVSGVVRTGTANYVVSCWNPSFVYAFQPVGEFLSANTAGTVSATNPMPAGMLPTAAPFTLTNLSVTAVYQPVYLCASFTYNYTGASPITHVQSEQGTVYLLQLPTTNGAVALPVATAAPRQVDLSGIYQVNHSVGSVTGPDLHCPHVGLYPVSAPRWFTSNLRTLGYDAGGTFAGVSSSWSVDFKFDTTSQGLLYQPAELGQELYLAAGYPSVCDGYFVNETSFFSYPEFFSAAISGGTWNGNTGSYHWACVYAYTDSGGQISRSAPVFASGLSMTAGGTGALLTIPPVSSYRASSGRVVAEIYRTTNTSGTEGGTYFLVSSVPLANNTLATYQDVSTDAMIATSTVLYTTGGILDCVNPPSFSCLIAHKTRLWGVDETGTNIWFTKRFTPGLAPGFNEALTLSFSDHGAITGLFSMDDKLIIGKSSGLWVVYGDGPADTGQGNDLTIPQPVACDSGPVDWRSGVVFPGGLIFRSATGFMLCDRGLNVSWIGKDVVDSLALYPTVLSAIVAPTATQVRFVCSNAAGATLTLIYDYMANKWLTHTYPQQSAGVTSACLASVVAGTNPSFATVTSNGYLWLERQPTDALAYFDDDDTTGTQHFNPTTVTTEWVKIQGVQGFQRARQVQLLFEEADDCGMTMGFAFNYTSTVAQTYTWPSTIIDQLPLGYMNVVQMYVGAQNNLQMAIQVTATDVAGTAMSNGKGARFVGLSLDLEKISDRYVLVPSIGKA